MRIATFWFLGFCVFLVSGCQLVERSAYAETQRGISAEEVEEALSSQRDQIVVDELLVSFDPDLFWAEAGDSAPVLEKLGGEEASHFADHFLTQVIPVAEMTCSPCQGEPLCQEGWVRCEDQRAHLVSQEVLVAPGGDGHPRLAAVIWSSATQ